MEYKLVYSDRRTVSLSVKDGGLIVRAPYGVSENDIKKIIASHESWIVKHIKNQQEKKEKYGELTDEKIKYLRKTARSILPLKTAYYANIMDLKYGRITITGAKTRFGSCSAKGNISYSYLLMQYPDEAIDYVVVHELAHLKEMNHSPAFYKIIESVLPDYKERRKLLKK